MGSEPSKLPATRGFCRGLEVTVTFDDDRYPGTGFYLLASVLEHFLGQYATIMARPAAEAIRRRAEEDGIEFFFAQFVDMNAKPSAKLVPMSNFEGLVTEGAGFAGFAAGPIGQTPASPDMMAIPDLASYTKVPFTCSYLPNENMKVKEQAWPCPVLVCR